MAKTKVQALASEASKQKTAQRTVDDLLVLQGTETLQIETVTEDEFKALCTQIAKDDDERKKLEGRVKLGKEIVLKWMELHTKHEVTMQDGAVVKASPTSSLEVLPSKLLELLRRVKKMNLVDEVLKVKLTEAKKYLGEDVLKKIGKKDIKEYARVSLG